MVMVLYRVMERVSINEGKTPVILIAPHIEDTNTGTIVESASNVLGGYSVINNGWKRADKYDYWTEKANCNNLHHCHEDVVKEEFLDPIIRFKNRILKKEKRVCIF